MSLKPSVKRLATWVHSHRRCYSSAKSLDYDPKVSAVPFAISPEEAIYQSAPFVYLHANNYTAAIQAFLSRFLRNRYDPPRPRKIEAVYLPTWLVDAEVTAKISDHTEKSTAQTQVMAQSLSTYFPGFYHFPLAMPKFPFKTRSLHSPTDEAFGSLPNSKQRITCLPYTRSPFTLPKAARSLSFEQSKIDSTLKVEPESIRFPLIGPAYPVLFPIYLMQWEGFDAPFDDKPRTFSTILDAHRPNGLLYIENYLQNTITIPHVDSGPWKISPRNLLMLSLNKRWEGRDAVYTEGDMCMKLYGGFNPPRSKQKMIHLDKMVSIPHMDQRVDKWLDRQLLFNELQIASATVLPKDVINWGDVRIRRLSPEEQAGNTKYWYMRMQTSAARSMMKGITGKKNWMAVILGSSGIQAGKGEEMQQRVQAELTRIERLAEESKPQWLKIAEQQANMTEV